MIQKETALIVVKTPGMVVIAIHLLLVLTAMTLGRTPSVLSFVVSITRLQNVMKRAALKRLGIQKKSL
jgi:hypothetical protein